MHCLCQNTENGRFPVPQRCFGRAVRSIGIVSLRLRSRHFIRKFFISTSVFATGPAILRMATVAGDVTTHAGSLESGKAQARRFKHRAELAARARQQLGRLGALCRAADRLVAAAKAEFDIQPAELAWFQNDHDGLDARLKIGCQAADHGFGPAGIGGIQPVEHRPASAVL